MRQCSILLSRQNYRPRPLPPPSKEQTRDEWDFLKPSKELAALPPDPNQAPEPQTRRGFFGGKTLALILSGK